MTSDPATPLIDLIQLAAADTDVVLDVDTSLDEMLRIAEITKLSASFAASQVGEVTFGRLDRTSSPAIASSGFILIL